MDLKNKVAIVTGGGHGIGRAYCRGLAKEGAKVVVADIDLPAAEETKRLMEQDGASALAVHVDVANEQSTLAMAEAVIKAYGKIDILINNAAVIISIPVSRVTFDKVPVEEWDKVMSVNLKGMWLCCRAVVPLMKKQKSGKIINISSGTALSGSPTRIHYTTSKAGVLGFTRSLARELGDFGITVNTLALGSTITEEQNSADAVALNQKIIERRCLKRVQCPEDLIGAMVFLCSNASDFMTGQTLNVDGGHVMI
jgi:3-oxoacyl-[acyl-carrier protein] reductase